MVESLRQLPSFLSGHRLTNLTHFVGRGIIARSRLYIDSGLASRPNSSLKQSSSFKVKEEKVYNVPSASESKRKGLSEIFSYEDIQYMLAKKADHFSAGFNVTPKGHDIVAFLLLQV